MDTNYQDTAAAKARLITLGLFHEGWDVLTEIFEIPVLEQRVRDLYRARERMFNINDALQVAVNDSKRFLAQAAKSAKQLDDDVMAAITNDDPNDDADAVLLRAEANAIRKQIETRTARLESQQAELAENDGCIKFLTMLFDQGSARIEELKDAKEDTKVTNASTVAIAGAQAVMQHGGFETAGEGIMRKNRIAHQRRQRVTSSVALTMNSDTNLAQARADIARMKAELNKPE